jgi:hypothetical protein
MNPRPPPFRSLASLNSSGEGKRVNGMDELAAASAEGCLLLDHNAPSVFRFSKTRMRDFPRFIV